MGKKQISVDVDLHEHGVKAPSLRNVAFHLYREVLDENGIYNPVQGAGTFEVALQISINADSEGYRELGKYFLGLAEYDVGEDPHFHHHHGPLFSADGRTRLHIIVRKDDVRYQTINRDQIP